MNFMDFMKERIEGKFFIDNVLGPMKVTDFNGCDVEFLYWSVDLCNWELGYRDVDEFDIEAEITKEQFMEDSLERYKRTIEKLGERFKRITI